MKLKKGMKVKLVNKLNIPKHDVVGGWNADGMGKYLGQTVTISSVNTVQKGFRIEEDNHRYIWDNRLIDRTSETKILNTLEEMKEVFDVRPALRAIPKGMILKKLIVNEPCIICFAEHEGKQYKVVTKCHAEDTFDLGKGMEITAYKLMGRVAQHKLEKLYK